METKTKDKIFCYSATGNSWAAAVQLASELNMEAVHLTDELAGIHVEGDVCIIIYPTYAYCMPNTVKRFILKSTFKVGYFAVLTTLGSHHGGALAESIRALKKRKQTTAYTMGIKSVENYVHMFGFQPHERIIKRTQMQLTKTKQIAEDIKARKTNKRLLFRPGSWFVSKVFRWAIKVFEKNYTFLDTCNNCGICAKVCPANAIIVEKDKKPTIKKKQCDHCQACMQLCPSQAIKFGRIKPGAPRYLHKDVKLKDLIKR